MTHNRKQNVKIELEFGEAEFTIITFIPHSVTELNSVMWKHFNYVEKIFCCR